MRKLFLLSALALAINVHADEYFVDPIKGDDSNSGDASAPFKTITAALKEADFLGGDTVTLKGGIYRERIDLGRYSIPVKATLEEPFVVQGAPGERVIVTGFEPITGWKEAGDGIYTAEVPEFINGLFVGLEAQPLARWPRDIGLWLPFDGDDEEAKTFSVEEGLDKCPDIADIATVPRSLQILMYLSRPNTYGTKPVTAVDPKTGTLTIGGEERWWINYTVPGNTLVLQNHPLLIKEPGDWAVAAKDDTAKDSTVYFKPKSPADLENVFYRTRGNLASVREATGVIIRNIEFSGAGAGAVSIGGSEDCIVESCIAHNCFGSGISARGSKNITFRNNIALANEDTGINVQSTDTALVEGNQIAHNMVDGLRVIGSVRGPGEEPESSNVTVRRNYMHHHFYLSHPDNMQIFRGVNNLKVEENVMLFGGQNLMTEENNDNELRANALLFTEAFNIIFGHKNSHRWLVEGNTVGYGGWGAFLMDGEGYQFFDNVFIGGGLGILADTKSDHNVFITRPYARGVLSHAHKHFTDIATGSAASGTDAHSLVFDEMPFKNMPKAFSICYAKRGEDRTPTATDWLVFRKHGGGGAIAKADGYAVGDHVEINGDGIMRKVTAVNDDGIQFAPALPQAPFRSNFLLNWGETTSTQLDLTLVDDKHPIMTAGREGKRAGATLDIAAFQRGELLETGKRNLPEIPDDLKAAWPNPNHYIPPMYGR